MRRGDSEAKGTGKGIVWEMRCKLWALRDEQEACVCVRNLEDEKEEGAQVRLEFHSV